MVNFTIEKFPQGIEDLAKRVNLDEPIDYGCEFVVARNGSIAGVAGVNFDKAEYPRFEHIIIDPKYQKGSLLGKLMLRTEMHLKNLGYHKYLAFIFKDNTRMLNYASKFGFKPYKNGNRGDWFIKEVRC